MNFQTAQKFKIKYVDGFLIRNTLDDNFAIAHYQTLGLRSFTAKYYIPANELWIDLRFKDETHFLTRIVVYQPARKHIDFTKERKEKKKNLCLAPPIPEVVVRQDQHSDLAIVEVKGDIIRKYLDPEFALGGHDLVYDYIPADQIWLETKLDPKEQPYILLHEQTERRLMSQGKSYDIAHDYATAADKELRRRDGVGHYPGDAGDPWYNLSNDWIKKRFYVQNK